MTYRIAIIGCGDMGNTHAVAWALRSDVKIAAVYDILDDRTKALAAKTGAKACECLEDAVVNTEVDIVSVCTPVCFHAEIGCLAMRHGRHVLCEKPIALTLDQADQMIATARENKVKLGVCYQYRGFPKNIKYKELFESGIFGGPVFARFVDIREVRPKLAMHRVSMNGGPLIDMSGHFYDLMRFVTGSEPQRVYARGHIFGRGKKRLEGLDDLAIDAAEITVDYSGGHVLTACVNWGMPESFPAVVSEQIAGPEAIVRPAGAQVEARFADHAVFHDLPPAPVGPSVRMADLIGAIEGNGQPEVSGAEGRIALQVSLAALESIETGQVVEIR